MTILYCALTRRAAGIRIAESIRSYYIHGGMDEIIGFNADGNLDYQFKCGQPVSESPPIVIVIFDTEKSELPGDTDYSDEKMWDAELMDYVADLATGEWLRDSNTDYSIDFLPGE